MEDASLALGVALDICRAHDAHLSCVYITPYAAYVGLDPMGGVFASGAVIESLREAEAAIRAKLASIGIGPGKKFNFKDLSVEHKAAILLAMKEGDSKVEKYLEAGQKDINGWKVGSLFGDRAFYNGNWLLRAAAATGGIYGNDTVEARLRSLGLYPHGKTQD